MFPWEENDNSRDFTQLFLPEITNKNQLQHPIYYKKSLGLSISSLGNIISPTLNPKQSKLQQFKSNPKP